MRRRRGDLDQKGQALEPQLRQLEVQADRRTETARVGLSMDAFCRRVRQGLGEATWEQKRQLIECLVARVVVTERDVEIRSVIPTSAQGETTRFCHLCADYRAPVGQAQGVESGRDTLREARRQLSRPRQTRRFTYLDAKL